MNMLDAHVEAMAFDYTVVIHLWTWVAVVTAAVSFWKIRASAGSKAMMKSDDVVQHAHAHAHAHAKESCYDDEKPNGCETKVSEEPSCACTFEVVDRDGSTKGKFALYFCEDGGGMESEVYEAGAGTETGECADCGEGDAEWWLRWEEVLRVKTGEIEWYNYQDLSLINGNVVRLWDDSCQRRRLSPSSAVF